MNHTPAWLAELLQRVREALIALSADQSRQAPALQAQLAKLDANCRGWLTSLGNPDLPVGVRFTIEQELAATQDRQFEIQNLLRDSEQAAQQVESLVSPEQVLERLARLGDVLGQGNPTRGNLELSMHIDRITCSPDGLLTMRTCKLGAMAEVIEVLSEGTPVRTATKAVVESKQTGPRRRARLRAFDLTGGDHRAQADFVGDTDRFGELGEDWFWTDEFTVPDRAPSWVEANAEAVFQRRQSTKLSCSKLAKEYGVSRPTISATIKKYLELHPGVVDEVKLQRGGQRPRKFDLAAFAADAKRLWLEGWSKLKLAEKYGCSTPVMDKALAHAFAEEGAHVPTRHDELQAKASQASELPEGAQSPERGKILVDLVPKKRWSPFTLFMLFIGLPVYVSAANPPGYNSVHYLPGNQVQIMPYSAALPNLFMYEIPNRPSAGQLRRNALRKQHAAAANAAKARSRTSVAGRQLDGQLPEIPAAATDEERLRQAVHAMSSGKSRSLGSGVRSLLAREAKACSLTVAEYVQLYLETEAQGQQER